MTHSKDRQMVEIPANLAEQRIVAAIQTLVGAAGALRRLREQQSDPHRPSPRARSTDTAQLTRLAAIVADIEKFAEKQSKERERLLHPRLHQEVLEAYQLFDEGLYWKRKGSKPVFPMGEIGDAVFPVAPGWSARERVTNRIRQAWWNYQRLSGVEDDISEQVLATIVSDQFLEDGRNQLGISETAKRAAALLLGRGDPFEADDADFKATSAGRGIAKTAANSHYDKRHHGDAVTGLKSDNVTYLSAAPSYGELGLFFGAGWPVDEAVAGVANTAVGHLLSTEYRAQESARTLASEYQISPADLVQTLLDRVVPNGGPDQRQNPTWLAATLGELVARLDRDRWPRTKDGRPCPRGVTARLADDPAAREERAPLPPGAEAMAGGDVWNVEAYSFTGGTDNE